MQQLYNRAYCYSIVVVASVWHLGIMCLLLGSALSYPSAQASQPSIGIALSDTCFIMVQQGFDTDCPSIEYLYSTGWDTTDPKVSGGFSVIDDVFQREFPQLQKHYRFYDFGTLPMIWIDPPADTRDKVRMIIIEAELKNYFAGGQMSKEKNQRSVSHDRYVDASCRNAVISAEKWSELIADTIYYMRNNCIEGYTNHDTIEVIEDEITEWDITTSQRWKDDQYLEWIKKNCLNSYGSCDAKP